jgi:hypothetical protein
MARRKNIPYPVKLATAAASLPLSLQMYTPEMADWYL